MTQTIPEPVEVRRMISREEKRQMRMLVRKFLILTRENRRFNATMSQNQKPKLNVEA